MNADLMMGCGAAASATRSLEPDIAESGIADSGEAMVDLAMVDLDIGSGADMIGFYPHYNTASTPKSASMPKPSANYLTANQST